MSAWRSWMKRTFPPLALDTVRDLRVLPPDARGAWWRATRHHLRQRDDELLPARLTPPLEIVTVCYGNIYRSPFAAALLQREAALRGWDGVRVSSTGFVRREGRSSPEDARNAARTHGVSLEGHSSSRITRETADAAALLLVMDRQHEALLVREFPHVLPKVVPLWRFGAPPGAREEVLHDPYGHGLAAIQSCYARIEMAVRALADALDDRGLNSTAAATRQS